MKSGVLVYDRENERMDIRFGLENYYGGLHCGTTFDVLIGRRWIWRAGSHQHNRSRYSGIYRTDYPYGFAESAGC